MTTNKGALAILVHGGTDNWSPRRWKGRFEGVCPDRVVRLLPDDAFDPAEVHYAAVWKPQPGELAVRGVQRVAEHQQGGDREADRPAVRGQRQHGEAGDGAGGAQPGDGVGGQEYAPSRLHLPPRGVR